MSPHFYGVKLGSFLQLPTQMCDSNNQEKNITLEPSVEDDGFGKLFQWMSVISKAVGLKTGYFK